MAEKKKLSKREKVLLGVTLSVAVFACLQYWFRPQLQRWREATAKISLVQSQITANQAVLQSLSLQRKPAGDDAGSSLQLIIDRNTSLPSFVSELTHKAVSSSFELQRIEMKEQEATEGLMRSDFNLVARASFSQLGQYLEALEKSPFVVQVKSVQIFRHEQDLRQLTTQLQMSTYHLLKETTK